MKNIVEKIIEIKEQKNACILAHNYQPGEIQDIADFVGDSLELSKRIVDLDYPIVVFCGVKFMAETAKILSPEKLILLPDSSATCDLAKSIQPEDVIKLKAQHPNAIVVCYINSTIEIKALSDYCCTSANALHIVESIPTNEIIFIPDQGLGSWIQEKTNKKIILHPGSCPVHYLLDDNEIKNVKKQHPDAPLITHPESNSAVRNLSDFVGGTGAMIRYAQETDYSTYLVATDEGMVHRLSKDIPDKKFVLAAKKISCMDMKKVTLEKVFHSLSNHQFSVSLDTHIAMKAYLVATDEGMVHSTF